MGCCTSRPLSISGSAPASRANSTTSSRDAYPHAAQRLPDHSSARFTLRHGPVPPNAESISAAAIAGSAATRPLRHATAWKSTSRTWTRGQLREEREAFFHTRVTGSPETWAAVRLAVETVRDNRDLETGQTILEAAGLSCPTGRLSEGIWDERGVLYKLPKFVCTDPVNVLEVDGEDGKEDGSGKEALDLHDEVEEDDDEEPAGGPTVKVKARLSDRAEDVVMHIDQNLKVRMIIRRICVEAKIPDSAKVKLAYLGKILRADESLSAQGWKEGQVINALVAYVPQ